MSSTFRLLKNGSRIFSRWASSFHFCPVKNNSIQKLLYSQQEQISEKRSMVKNSFSDGASAIVQRATACFIKEKQSPSCLTVQTKNMKLIFSPVSATKCIICHSIKLRLLLMRAAK